VTADEEQRTEMLHEMDMIAAEEQIFIWLWSPERPPGINARLQNSRWGPTYVPYYMGIEDWWLKQ
jgi:ABC-type transport system substrate-binding protein